jgi:hypothetical protein
MGVKRPWPEPGRDGGLGVPSACGFGQGLAWRAPPHLLTDSMADRVGQSGTL